MTEFRGGIRRFSLRSPLSAGLILGLLIAACGFTASMLSDGRGRPVAVRANALPPAPASVAADLEAYISLPTGAARRFGDLGLRHPQAVTIHFPADGTTLITGGSPGLRVWDLASRKLLRQYPRESFTGWPATSTPDNKYIVAMGDGLVNVIDRADGRSIRRLSVDGDRLACFAVSPDGRTVATGSWGGVLQLWELETGRRLPFRAVHPPPQPVPTPGVWMEPVGQPPIFHVAFSPDGAVIASAAMGDIVRGWDIRTAEEVWHLDPKKTSAGPFTFSPDGALVAVATIQNGLAVWRIADRSIAVEMELAGAPFGLFSVAFSQDGRSIAAGGSNCTLRVWDARSGKLRFSAPTASSIQEVQFSRDGKRVACVSLGVGLWDVETGRELLGEEGHIGSIGAIAISPEGDRVVTAGNEGTVRAWNTATGAQRWVSPIPRGGDWPADVAISPDGKSVAVAGCSGIVRVLDAATGREIRRMPELGGTAFRVAYSPDGQLLAALGRNSTVHLWDATGGIERGKFVGYDGWGGDWGSVLRFSPDSKYVIASSNRGPGGGQTGSGYDPALGPGADPDEKIRLVLWEVEAGKRIRRLGAPSIYGARDAVFLSAETLAVQAGGEVSIVDIRTGAETRRFPATENRLALSPDGHVWVGAVRYNSGTGAKVSELSPGSRCTVAISKNGKVLIAASGGGCTAEVWDLSAQAQ